MESVQIATVVLDYAAVFVFGATGALAAARRRHDIVTFGFFAAITGVGGGTLRDVLIDAPVFWVARPGYIVACVGAAVAVWLLGPRRFRARLLTWLDALGMSAYTVVGAAKALSLGVSPLSAVIMGVLTATFGGVLRDVLAEEPSILLRREIYVTAALAGAMVYVLLSLGGLAALPAALAGFGTAAGVRGGAIIFGWSLPSFGKPDEGEKP